MAKSSVTKQSIQDAQQEHDTIARAIEDVATAARALKNTRLTDKALYLLLAHESGCAQSVCRAVLESAASLDRTFVKRSVSR